MNEENSYLIEIEGLEEVPGNVLLYAGHQWARPSVEHLRHLMRYVFEHRQEARTKGIESAGGRLPAVDLGACSNCGDTRTGKIQSK